MAQAGVNSGQIMSTNQTLLSFAQTDRPRYSARSRNIPNLSDSFRPLPFQFCFSTCQTIGKNEKEVEKMPSFERYAARRGHPSPATFRKNAGSGKTARSFALDFWSNFGLS